MGCSVRAQTHCVRWPTRGKAGDAVTEHPGDRQGRGGLSTTEEILTVCTLCEKQAMTLPICSTSSTARHGRSCWLQ